MNRKREFLQNHQILINSLINISKIFPKSLYLNWLKLIRHHDNYIAMFIRLICLKNCAKSCGNNVAIFSNVYLNRIHNLEIGNNVSIHPLCYIDAATTLTIGNNVSIAHNTTILAEEHKYANLNMNIKDQGYEYKKTIIEENVWIGAGSRILGGAHIESGSVIAAGAVVKNLVNSNTVVAGIPAKVIKYRKKEV